MSYTFTFARLLLAVYIVLSYACVLFFDAGALSVGGLLLLTGVGVGATALLAVMEAAAISNLMSPHIMELVQAGDYSQVMADVMSGAVNGVAETVSASSSSVGDAGALPDDSDIGDIPK